MSVQEIIKKRYSSRSMDSTKKISETDIDLILDAGVRAPNGYGTEAWKFLSVSGNKEKLMEASYGQKHVGDSSHVIVLLAYKDEYLRENKDIIMNRYKDMKFSEDMLKYYEKHIFNLSDLTKYIEQQNHIAAGYMALQATELGIGSVIVGGMDKKAVASCLDIDTNMFEVSLIVSLGYSLDEAKVRIHRTDAEVIEKIVLK